MLFVHIGNRKAGSTTIQTFAFNNRSGLERRGIIYPEIGLKKDKHRPIAEALRSGESGADCLQRLEAELRRNPERRYLISGEEFFKLKSRAIRRLLGCSGGHQVKAIAYLREYPDWIQSSYTQNAKMGRLRKDFDAFFDERMKRASVIPALEMWASVLGPENIRIRSTNPASLHGGTLIGDLLEAVQAGSAEDELPLDWTRANVAPSWPVVELHRALNALQLGERYEPLGWRLRKSAAHDFEACLRREWARIPPASYQTRGQFEAAASLYNRDVGILNEKFGSEIPPVLLAGFTERAFLPTFDAVPLRLRRAFLRRLFFRLIRDSILRKKPPKYIAAKRKLWRDLSLRYGRRPASNSAGIRGAILHVLDGKLRRGPVQRRARHP